MRRYVGGDFHILDGLSRDYMNLLQIRTLSLIMGYRKHMKVFYYYKNLEIGKEGDFVPMSTDEHVMKMTNSLDSERKATVYMVEVKRDQFGNFMEQSLIRRIPEKSLSNQSSDGDNSSQGSNDDNDIVSDHSGKRKLPVDNRTTNILVSSDD